MGLLPLVASRRPISGLRLRPDDRRTVILHEQTCPSRAGSRQAPPEMGKEASRGGARRRRRPRVQRTARQAARPRTGTTVVRAGLQPGARHMPLRGRRNIHRTRPRPRSRRCRVRIAPSLRAKGVTMDRETEAAPRHRRRQRTASPRSSNGRPTRRVNRPPARPSAHRKSRGAEPRERSEEQPVERAPRERPPRSRTTVTEKDAHPAEGRRPPPRDDRGPDSGRRRRRCVGVRRHHVDRRAAAVAAEEAAVRGGGSGPGRPAGRRIRRQSPRRPSAPRRPARAEQSDETEDRTADAESAAAGQGEKRRAAPPENLDRPPRASVTTPSPRIAAASADASTDAAAARATPRQHG